MAEQRAPNLQQMDEQQAHRLLAELFSRLSAQAEDRIRHEDYTMEWPQSGERLRGRQKMKAFQEANVGAPSQAGATRAGKGGTVGGRGDRRLWRGREVDFVLILELRDGKVFRETRYYADPFEAPESRARWFERMER